MAATSLAALTTRTIDRERARPRRAIAGPRDTVHAPTSPRPGAAEGGRDKAGHPFVGPAGKVLDDALAEAGLDDVPCYVTNAVKHFNWEPGGRRRLHMKPNLSHVLACRFWLEEEIAVVAPRVIVALGATAARAVLGPSARVLRDRGRWLPSTLAPNVTMTVHPSSLLRAPRRRRARKHGAPSSQTSAGSRGDWTRKGGREVSSKFKVQSSKQFRNERANGRFEL
jgi:DNA polymerase